MTSRRKQKILPNREITIEKLRADYEKFRRRVVAKNGLPKK